MNAVAGGAPIDDLVLWAVPASGRRLVRELRAFASLYTVEIDPVYAPDEPTAEPEQLSDGSLEVSGFLLSASTVEALGALDLAALRLPDHPGRRVLLLERDGIEPALGASRAVREGREPRSRSHPAPATRR